MNATPWLNSYPPSVPNEINADQYENLVDFFEECINAYHEISLLRT